jgi:hypothetical protein
MAVDKSEPKVGMIAKVAVLAIATLIGVHEALVAYFDQVAQAEEYRKVGSEAPEALLNARADEKRRLETGPMPIEKAMQAIAAKGRMGASPEIAPSASRDVAPLQGWAKLPQQVPSPMMAPEPSAAPAASSSAAPAPSGAPAAAEAAPKAVPKTAPKPTPDKPQAQP